MKKSTKRLCAIAIALLGALSFSSCSTVTETGRRQFNIVSASQASQMGLTEFNKIKRTKRISYHPHYNGVVSRVGARLVRVVPMHDARWEFVVFEDESPNAFALPGGKVGINTGLFKVAPSEAAIAAVIGHEIAHVVADHGGERMSHQTASGVVGALVGAYLNNQQNMTAQQRNGFLAAYGAGAVVGHTLPHSRKQEYEADEIGTLYMARAGYDPREAIALWQRFAQYKSQAGNARKSDFLSTHPLDQSRINRLQQLMPHALAEYSRATGGVMPVAAPF